MKKLIISALCLIWCFVVCIQPVYADDSDNIKTGDRIEIDSHGNIYIYKVDAFGNRIDDYENCHPNYANKVCKDSKKLIHDTNAWLSHDTYIFFYIRTVRADNRNRYFQLNERKLKRRILSQYVAYFLVLRIFVIIYMVIMLLWTCIKI